jgi:hypothetical protein
MARKKATAKPAEKPEAIDQAPPEGTSRPTKGQADTMRQAGGHYIEKGDEKRAARIATRPEPGRQGADMVKVSGRWVRNGEKVELTDREKAALAMREAAEEAGKPKAPAGASKGKG